MGKHTLKPNWDHLMLIETQSSNMRYNIREPVKGYLKGTSDMKVFRNIEIFAANDFGRVLEICTNLKF